NGASFVTSVDVFSGQTKHLNIFLGAGNYTFYFDAGSQDNSAIAALNYSVKGVILTDAIGGRLIDPANPPARLTDWNWQDFGSLINAGIVQILDIYGRSFLINIFD